MKSGGILHAIALLATLARVQANHHLRGLRNNLKGDCIVLELGRQLIPPLLKDGEDFTPPPLPEVGSVVSQTSYLCNQTCQGFPPTNQIGTVHAEAAILPGGNLGPPDDEPLGVRLGRGTYNLESETFGTGSIYFQGSVANELAGGEFEVAVVGGTGDFRCAEGYIEIGAAAGPPPPKRNATIHLCNGFCSGDLSR